MGTLLSNLLLRAKLTSPVSETQFQKRITTNPPLFQTASHEQHFQTTALGAADAKFKRAPSAHLKLVSVIEGRDHTNNTSLTAETIDLHVRLADKIKKRLVNSIPIRLIKKLAKHFKFGPSAQKYLDVLEPLRIQALKTGAENEYVQFLNEAKIHHPNNALFSFFLGEYYLTQGNLTLAKAYFVEALGKDTQHFLTRLHMGQLEYIEENYDRSLEHYTEAFKHYIHLRNYALINPALISRHQEIHKVFYEEGHYELFVICLLIQGKENLAKDIIDNFLAAQNQETSFSEHAIKYEFGRLQAIANNKVNPLGKVISLFGNSPVN